MFFRDSERLDGATLCISAFLCSVGAGHDIADWGILCLLAFAECADTASFHLFDVIHFCFCITFLILSFSFSCFFSSFLPAFTDFFTIILYLQAFFILILNFLVRFLASFQFSEVTFVIRNLAFSHHRGRAVSQGLVGFCSLCCKTGLLATVEAGWIPPQCQEKVGGGVLKVFSFHFSHQ